MSDSKLLIATSNNGKIREISTLLSDCNRELVFLSELHATIVEPEETGVTFAENAALKARYYSQLSQLPAVADDSGLSVLELDGFPGVNSARWTGATDSERVAALLALMEKNGLVEPIQRRAYFSCVVSLAQPSHEKTLEFEGICWGTLAHVPLGETGFGYDPIFIPDGENQTMAQLGQNVKNTLSARAKAFKSLKNWLLQH